MLSLKGKAPVPSVLCLNGNHGEEIEMEVVPVDVEGIWRSGRSGVYSLTDRVYEMFAERYENNPRVFVTGPAALNTDMGGIMSVPINKGRISYWVSGVLAAMAIMGKYYMNYSHDFVPPRTLGRMCAERMKKELILDNLGVCRFLRGWAVEMLPEVMGSLYGSKESFLRAIEVLASRLNSRNSPIFWESERNIDYLHTFLRRKKEVDHEQDPRLDEWLAKFEADKIESARGFWYQTLMGIDESLNAPES
jgi:aldehyde:ferredoxin oxidoreductase